MEDILFKWIIYCVIIFWLAPVLIVAGAGLLVIVRCVTRWLGLK